MNAPIDLLTWGGAGALALLLTQLLKYRMPEGYRCPPLICVLVAVSLLMGYAWLRGTHDPAGLAEVAVLGLFAGASAVGLFEMQKCLPMPVMGSVTPDRSKIDPSAGIPVAIPLAVPVGRDGDGCGTTCGTAGR
jgi:hypothetical protein